MEAGIRKMELGRRGPAMEEPRPGRKPVPDLNNLYGLIPPPGRRRLFCVRPAGWRRVSWTLFVNWFTWRIFRTVFGHKFRAGPPYNDQKWEPIYLFFLSAKIRAQYIYFFTFFINILGPDFVTILEPRLFK